ncbi:MHYT domain-containing protein [Streptomyces sp. NPDC008061]|uniref:MHYT domain-containing protein n=1 Tax=Streptomyces sp. NPDC008061 TaxID=3364805 RepID=UPI0036E85662
MRHRSDALFSGSLALGHQHLYAHAVIPVLAYATVFLGSVQAWAGMARFQARRTKPGWMWLTTGALALGFGSWGMHMIAVLGFDFAYLTVRHDIPLTALSGLLCVGSTMLGLFVADRRRSWPGLLTASAVLTGGLIGAHLLSMTALDTPAEFQWSVGTAMVSAVLAIVGVMATLWLTVTIGPKPLAIGATLLTAAVLCAAQYTALDAVTVTSTGEASGPDGDGLSGPALIVPLAAILVMVILTVAFNLYVTPVQDVHDTPTRHSSREAPKLEASDSIYGAERVTNRPSTVPTDAVGVVQAGPVVHIAGY